MFCDIISFNICLLRYIRSIQFVLIYATYDTYAEYDEYDRYVKLMINSIIRILLLSDLIFHSQKGD